MFCGQSVQATYESNINAPHGFKLTYKNDADHAEHLKDLYSVLALDIAEYASETLSIFTMGTRDADIVRGTALTSFTTKMAKVVNSLRLLSNGHVSYPFVGPAIKGGMGPIVDAYLALKYDLEKFICAKDIAGFNRTRHVSLKEKIKTFSEMALCALLTLFPSAVYTYEVYKAKGEKELIPESIMGTRGLLPAMLVIGNILDIWRKTRRYALDTGEYENHIEQQALLDAVKPNADIEEIIHSEDGWPHFEALDKNVTDILEDPSIQFPKGKITQDERAEASAQ